ncbi:ABC transporter permease [Sediminispirochaeta smaragdinae]|uniref:Inner-membrane translocator n=1 Tax=Sediminispirochaeta smaragdinae (strain DSM 11293 / JCM 15392 / SEBR 4228) TaxID=573413 RepID=E1R9W2_SEDSS|nr:ABC transporter permease [Sediminispirochaeta smaragdinae]ADK83281.1 inner-membrane translocator [Sediminispirochaeta smaragdinae DSM 11293]
MLKRHNGITNTEMALFAIILIYSIVVGVVNSGFFNIDTQFDIIRSSSYVMVLAMGLLVVMLSGGIDISFMAMALFGSYTATKILVSTGSSSILLAFAISMGVGIGLGIINALLVSWLRLPPFIITLGTSNLFHGVMATFIGAKTYGGGRLPPSYSNFGSSTLFKVHTDIGDVGLSTSILFVLGAVLLTYFLIYRTTVGRGIVALGNSEEATKRIGYKPLLLRIVAYGYMGLLAGCAGMIYVCQVNAVYPDKMVGNELMVVAGVIIGGVSISGGKGRILGALLGIFIIYLLNSTLIFLGLTSSWNQLFVGAILIISVAVTSYQEKKKNQKHLIFNASI